MEIKISEHFTYKKLLRFVLPSIFMMIITFIYGVIDGLFISNFAGKTPFSAINFIMPFIMILGGMGFMIGTGGTALVSKTIGENKKDLANQYFSLLIVFTICLGLFLSVLGLVFMEPVARLLGASDDMMEYCIIYGRVCVAFVPFFMLQNIFQSFLITANKPKLGLMITIIAGVTNVALDALFIVLFKWGVAGAALATGLGQILGGVIPLIYFIRKNDSQLRFVKPKFEFKPIVKACTNGSSELLSNIATSIVSMLYNVQLMRYIGEDGVSSYGVLMYVQLIFLAIEIGYTMGSTPIIGYNYGAKNNRELKNVFKKSVLMMSFSGIALSILAQIFAIPLAQLFVGYDKKLFELTIHAFRIFSFAFVFSGINIFSSGFFTGLNNGFISALISFLRALVFQILFVLLLPYLFNETGIWISMFATELCAFIVSIICLIINRKKYNYA